MDLPTHQVVAAKHQWHKAIIDGEMPVASVFNPDTYMKYFKEWLGMPEFHNFFATMVWTSESYSVN